MAEVREGNSASLPASAAAGAHVGHQDQGLGAVQGQHPVPCPPGGCGPPDPFHHLTGKLDKKLLEKGKARVPLGTAMVKARQLLWVQGGRAPGHAGRDAARGRKRHLGKC